MNMKNEEELMTFEESMLARKVSPRTTSAKKLADYLQIYVYAYFSKKTGSLNMVK